MRHFCLALVIVWGFSPLAASAQSTCETYEPDQGWNAATREAFWFTGQGSRLVRASWFLALEMPSSSALLKNSLESFGYIPVAPSTLNRDGLPVGFVRDGTGPESEVGFTCAACHTQRIRVAARPVMIEGGATLADLEAFMRTLEQSMAATAADDAKFTRFATAVLGANHSPSAASALRTALREKTAMLATRWNAHWPDGGSGPGRVDAFGQIFNQVAAYDIGVPDNARKADAPVSYPFLWNTPQHNKVQWNGSATNGLLGLGPLFRNIGEVLGVFGEVQVVKPGLIPKYKSSVNLAQLRRLEEMLTTLKPPQWPRACAPVDAGRVRAGKKIYDKTCKDCHQPLARGDLKSRVKARMRDVKTDSRMVDNFYVRFLTYTLRPGVLKGGAGNFGNLTRGQDILSNVILGTYFGGGSAGERVESQQEEKETKAMRKFLKEALKVKTEYKARPLTGIWATAPYLHNGSVPTLEELLKPETERQPSFFVGNTNYDLAAVGFSTTQVPGSVAFDTRQDGNRNTGHSGPRHGTDLSHEDKKSLLEYLKVIGEE